MIDLHESVARSNIAAKAGTSAQRAFRARGVLSRRRGVRRYHLRRTRSRANRTSLSEKVEVLLHLEEGAKSEMIVTVS